MKKLKKAAFTLAEVLITLVIIGIVAALTIPSLISRYKDHVTVTKLKKAQSILANAFDMQKANEDWIIGYHTVGYHTVGYHSGYSTYWTADADTVAKTMNKYIKGTINTNPRFGAGYEIESEDGIVYGFHTPYQIYAILDKKACDDAIANGYHNNVAIVYGFDYAPDVGLRPIGYDYGIEGYHAGSSLRNFTCPDPWIGSPCTYWTLKTGKVKKKANEWFD